MRQSTRIRKPSEDVGIVPHEDLTNEFNKDGTDPSPTERDVGRMAYFAFLSRGSAHGGDVEDWLGAEIELNAGRNEVHPHHR
jgi:hypothetical protein